MDTNADIYIKQRYSIGKTLGEGGSSRVLEVTEISTGKKFALKIMNKNLRLNQRTFEQETNILKILQHPNIMAYKESHSDSRYNYIVCELCEGGDLLERVLDSEWSITESKASQLIRTILNAVQYCHENNIVHRDLKPENFVFKTTDVNSEILLVDFGCAKIVQDNKTYRDTSGTLWYISPEVAAGPRMRRTGSILKSSDMWSIGVIAYILMTGKVPFPGKTRAAVLNRILHKSLVFREGAEKLSKSFQDFCKRVLVKCPRQRMTVSEALEHPWVQGKFIPPEVLQRSPSRESSTALIFSLESGTCVSRVGKSFFILGSDHHMDDICEGVFV